ncbi:hypothetical protein BDF22DRAFT_657082 [Syncephalis plumigaleata]|nr:hypothetical protein BDF22DRAFT_657082 [Syncephalis plumigaleata]
MVSFRSLSSTAIVVLVILGCASAASVTPLPGSQPLTGGQVNPQLQAGQIGGLTQASSQDLMKNQQPTPQVSLADAKQIIAKLQVTKAETDNKLAALDMKVAETKKMLAALNMRLTEKEQKKRLVNPQQLQQ